MRSLSRMLAGNLNLQAVVFGGDDVSYGLALLDEAALRGDVVNWSRVHFLGRVPYSTFRNAPNNPACTSISLIHSSFYGQRWK